ncbi:MAG TPA: NHL repeat-containing protein [Candidatus Hydrogenedentes bacterium]|nr:NHL repeat-containing protein [Candidatus Hydrogenedentota bacterium]HQH52584.1 NHL repeat-containing protein [Candidatus Hydrogenedentota bacterium]
MQLNSSRRFLAVFTVCALAFALVSASSRAADAEAPGGRANIRPSLVQLAPGGTQAFRAVFEPGWLHEARVADTVSWAVNGIPGGNESLGTIDKNGLYRAPGQAPRPCEVHVCATVDGALNPHLWATVVVGTAAPAYELVAKWEEAADGSGRLKDPLDIALDRDGNLLISDGGLSQVLRFTAKGEFLGSIGEGGGNTPGHFGELRNVDVDGEGRIVACDMRTGPPRIQVFDNGGKLLHAFALKGVGPGQIMQPAGLAFDPAGRIFAADADNMLVNVYEQDGTFVEAWRRNGVRPGDLNEPYGAAADRNGDVFVPNYYGPCQKFTGKGEFLLAFAQPDPPDGPVAITSAAGDQWGNVFLAVRDTAGLVQNSANPEPKPARIMKFNNNGDLVTSLALWDDERGENKTAVDGHDRLYVLFKRVNTVGVAIFEAR